MSIEFAKKIEELAGSLEADILCYSGPIVRQGYEKLTDLVETSKKRTNAFLVLETYGGDADAGFRIARALRHHYKGFKIFVAGACKSAGTLIALGADELIISDRGELGPLDVQISKPDEMFEFGSGLDLMQSLALMQEQAMQAFRSYLIDIKTGSGVTTKTSAEMAAKLAIGLFAPVYQQLDPIRLGEVQRAIEIAYAYGERLNAYSKNLLPGALARLVTSYPSHGFVIDRKEARELFECIRAPGEIEEQLGRFLCRAYPATQRSPVVVKVKDLICEHTEADTSNESENAGTDVERNQGCAEAVERINEGASSDSDPGPTAISRREKRQ